MEFQWIFTDDFYIQNFSNRENNDFIENLILLNKQSIIPNYVFAIFVVFIPAFSIAACLWLGFSIIEFYVKFADCLKISAWANLIFPINYLFSVFLRITGFLPYNGTNVNNNFSYQSILCFIEKDIPDWLIYPLEKINITEFIFILLVSIFISKKFSFSLIRSVLYTTLFYGTGLFIWIIFTVYLQYLYDFY